ncbi:glutathione S-transferase family protein [Rhizorhabdus dicambivorans]|uniref:Glutathione S-transferase n=1 Tax=Rhizorhabdus dicambivorans TaxID=1850238 RepID=A0A2A4FUK4_9SPHN|nr:glutathione S-transferase N-terminal domain-containing protein [Rhizorhabdus dicambivorans]ATE66171.1 glutathione S-transferase [Rhizorhabdus dicambivorans]PCE42098.1 glutathione S-transferase [Rhizorhabdus dicambivorans]
MIEFYYNPGPNPLKVALFLEEAGLDYHLIPVDPVRGEQFTPAFTAINPNNKLPAIVDGDATIFDSNAILLYLAEKTGRFLPGDTLADRGKLLSWMMFIASGVGPYCGQAVHFRLFAPDPKNYALDRYLFEARRHYGILDRHLAEHEWMVGSQYTVADMATWAWGRHVNVVLGDGAAADFPHLQRFAATIEARPAAIRALALKQRHAFKLEIDDEFRRNLFRHVQPA